MELISGDLGFLDYIRGKTNRQVLYDATGETESVAADETLLLPGNDGLFQDQIAVDEHTDVGAKDGTRGSDLPANSDEELEATSDEARMLGDDPNALAETSLQTPSSPATESPKQLDATVGWTDTDAANSGNPGPAAGAGITAPETGAQLIQQPKLKAPPTDYQRLRETMMQIAAGVLELHRHGKLHRDLKPGNTMVRPDGRVVLLDFGLVAELSESVELQQNVDQSITGDHERLFHSSDPRIMGTLRYMSPEQASANPLTPATDWYAFGVMLYKALTDQRPFTGTAKEVIKAKRKQDGPPPSALYRGIPEDLDQLCVDLLKVDPAKRPRGPEILARLSGHAAPAQAQIASTQTPATPFVGRETHLESLTEAFQVVRSGQAAVQARISSQVTALPAAVAPSAIPCISCWYSAVNQPANMSLAASRKTSKPSPVSQLIK
jgi:hypothetical protein